LSNVEGLDDRLRPRGDDAESPEADDPSGEIRILSGQGP
jgi:hypothetical protein